MPSSLKINRDTSTPESLLRRENVDVSTFSDMRKCAYNDCYKQHNAHSTKQLQKNKTIVSQTIDFPNSLS